MNEPETPTPETPSDGDFSRRRISLLLSLSVLCCLGVPLVSWTVARVDAELSPYVPLIAGGVCMFLTIPLVIWGTKRPALHWLLWLSVFLNTVGSGSCSAAYTLYREASPPLSEAMVSAMLPACLLLIMLVLALLLPERHREKVAGICAILGFLMLIFTIVAWIKAANTLFYAGCFFSTIMTEALLIALVYACNDPRMTGTAYAVASCCYLAIIALIVLIILVCIGGDCDCDGCDGDCCDCGDCCNGCEGLLPSGGNSKKGGTNGE